MNIKIDGLEELAEALEKASAKIPNAKRQFLAKKAGSSPPSIALAK